MAGSTFSGLWRLIYLSGIGNTLFIVSHPKNRLRCEPEKPARDGWPVVEHFSFRIGICENVTYNLWDGKIV
ncbi:hypothetical protein [Angelakisella massiliensis]|uniref:hypothetical protein n=1 Tax=Angelakisella massiliensis TaxID=1871018 RepID=UPI0008F90EAE|nr:hypothetical protein [Angelakisella massiliensis]